MKPFNTKPKDARRGETRPTEHELTGDLSLAALIREDLRTHRGDWTEPGFHALVLHRIAVRAQALYPGPRRLVRRVMRILNSLLIRNLYGLTIYRETVIGRRVLFGHHAAITIGHWVVIESDCEIMQSVTLGCSSGETWLDMPWIGRGVELGAGCCIHGRVKVGEGARIGANALVVKDVPPGTIVLAPLGQFRPPVDS